MTKKLDLIRDAKKAGVSPSALRLGAYEAWKAYQAKMPKKPSKAQVAREAALHAVSAAYTTQYAKLHPPTKKKETGAKKAVRHPTFDRNGKKVMVSIPDDESEATRPEMSARDPESKATEAPAPAPERTVDDPLTAALDVLSAFHQLNPAGREAFVKLVAKFPGR